MFLRPNFDRAKTAILLIYIMLGLQIVYAFSNYFQYELLSNIEKGIVSYEDAQANDTRQQFIVIIVLVVSIVSAITFIQWFRRAYFNLHTVTENLKFTEGWAAGSWFVPILNLFRPYQIMRELFERSNEIISEKMGAFHPKNYRVAIDFWWALWVISNVLTNFSLRLMPNSGSIEDLKTETLANVFLAILEIPLALVTVKVIKLYADQELVLEEALNLDINNIGADVKDVHSKSTDLL